MRKWLRACNLLCMCIWHVSVHVPYNVCVCQSWLRITIRIGCLSAVCHPFRRCTWRAPIFHCQEIVFLLSYHKSLKHICCIKDRTVVEGSYTVPHSPKKKQLLRTKTKLTLILTHATQRTGRGWYAARVPEKADRIIKTTVVRIPTHRPKSHFELCKD